MNRHAVTLGFTLLSDNGVIFWKLLYRRSPAVEPRTVNRAVYILYRAQPP